MDREQYRQRIIEWQDWRNEQYSDLANERRRVANLRRHVDIKVSAHNGYPERQAADIGGIDNEISILNEMDDRYNKIVWLDTRIKSAWNSTECKRYLSGEEPEIYTGKPDDLPELLDEAEQMMK